MNITRRQLDEAARQKIITSEQADKLYDFLKISAGKQHGHGDSASMSGTRVRFTFSTVLYYMGGLVAIGAMTLFMNLGWERFGGWGIFFLSAAYACAGLYLTRMFRNRGYAVPAALCAAFTVAVTPLAIYGFQQAMGWWPDRSVYREYHHYIRWHWIYMELGTLAAGGLVLWFFRYPFLLMPVAVTLWYMSMDMAVMIAGGHADMQFRAVVTMLFGLAVTAVAFIVDIRTRRAGDFAFWLYMAGAAALWGGMMTRLSHGEAERFISLIGNIVFVFSGVVLARRVFVVLGALGCTFYLGHLAWTVFRESVAFPFVLTALGLGIIYLGILWQKNEGRIAATMRGYLPAALKELTETRDND